MPRDGAEYRRIVVRESNVTVARPERGERRQQQVTGRQETAGALRKPIEVLGAEARRPGLVEIVSPGELGQQAPELAERGVGLHLHVSIPDGLARTDTVVYEPQGLGREQHAGIEQ